MHLRPLLAAVFLVALATTAHADDDMLGTFVNGRHERANERNARVQDPAMDREAAAREREQRLRLGKDAPASAHKRPVSVRKDLLPRDRR